MSRYARFFLSFALVAVLLFGWSAEGAAQYPWWGPYPYPRAYRFDPGAAVRLEVRPKEAEVYVDGYYAGIVDDFNGAFQRLRLPPGEHEIVLYRDGYRTVHQKVYLTPDNTLKLKLAMERLGTGEQPEPRPQPASPPPTRETGEQNPPGAPGTAPTYPNPPRGGQVGRRPPQPQPAPMPPPNRPSSQPSRAPAGAYGTLTIRVQPADVDVVVDGEKWRGPEGQETLAIDMAEGRHTIQIQKPGYRAYVTEVEIRRGETTTLNVSLRSQE